MALHNAGEVIVWLVGGLHHYIDKQIKPVKKKQSKILYTASQLFCSSSFNSWQLRKKDWVAPLVADSLAPNPTSIAKQ